MNDRRGHSGPAEPEGPPVDGGGPSLATHHLYASTYCQHEQHDHCRLSCKICGAPCLCPCHRRSMDDLLHDVTELIPDQEP